MMEIRKKLVDPSKYGTKCPNTMNPEFITVHNT
ncbi:N-acetylmuramoyl-L-alanine amidase, partial [Bacillus cereus]